MKRGGNVTSYVFVIFVHSCLDKESQCKISLRVKSILQTRNRHLRTWKLWF